MTLAVQLDRVIEKGVVEVTCFLKCKQAFIGQFLQWLVGLHPDTKRQAESLFLLVDGLLWQPIGQGDLVKVAEISALQLEAAWDFD